MELNDWTLNFLTIYRIVEPETDEVDEDGEVVPGEGEKTVELVSSSAGFPGEDPVLEDLLDACLVDVFKKRPDTGETCGCKVWAFQPTPPGAEDKTLLSDARDATSIKGFQVPCRRLANRWASTAGTRGGLLIFCNLTATPKKGLGGTFFSFFVLDFEDLRRYDPEEGHMESVRDAVARKVSKALLYPYHNGRDVDFDHVKLAHTTTRGGTLGDLLYLEAPRTTRELLEDELRKAVTARPGGEKLESYFEKEPPKERELFGEERYIDLKDLLPPDDVVHLSKQSFQTGVDNHGKKARVRIVVDEGVKFEGELDKLGVSFFFARKGASKFIIVRGEKFLTKSQLSSIEFLDVQDLDEVLVRAREDS